VELEMELDEKERKKKRAREKKTVGKKRGKCAPFLSTARATIAFLCSVLPLPLSIPNFPVSH
jgi:hypothetical protein